MARAHFVKRANKNIYRRGKHVTYTSKKGKRVGQQKSKLDRTIPADEKDEILIKKGESYYWWQFRHGGKNFSKNRPKNSQLTQSEYLSTLYGIQESIEDMTASDADDLQSQVDDIKTQLEELRDQQEEKKSNMPDSLQESPTGELLQERYDALDNAINEIEGIDLDDYDEPSDEELRDEAIDSLGLEPRTGDGEEEEEEGDDVNENGFTDEQETQIAEEIEELKETKLKEWIDDKITELQGVSFD